MLSKIEDHYPLKLVLTKQSIISNFSRSGLHLCCVWAGMAPGTAEYPAMRGAPACMGGAP